MLPGRQIALFFIVIVILSSAQAQECRKGILDLPSSHWLRQETVNTQKQLLLWLSYRNAYFCDRKVMGNDLLEAIEKAAESNSREELDLTINIALSMVPTEQKKKKMASLVGDRKLNNLLKNHPESFDPVATGKAWGLIPSFPEEDRTQEP